MAENAVYIRCNGTGASAWEVIDDKKTVTKVEDTISFEYFGGETNDGYLDQKYFPFGGKKNQPDYQSPIVAVKVNGLQVRRCFFSRVQTSETSEKSQNF